MAQWMPRSARFCALRAASWTLFSPICVMPAAWAARSRSSDTVLVTGSSRISAASRPARAAAASMRARTAARFAAICSAVPARAGKASDGVAAPGAPGAGEDCGAGCGAGSDSVMTLDASTGAPARSGAFAGWPRSDPV